MNSNTTTALRQAMPAEGRRVAVALSVPVNESDTCEVSGFAKFARSGRPQPNARYIPLDRSLGGLRNPASISDHNPQ